MNKVLTINEIIIEALHDLENWVDGVINWNYVDSDLWLHPHSSEYTDMELCDGLNNFPNELVPVFGEFTPRVTHPIP